METMEHIRRQTMRMPKLRPIPIRESMSKYPTREGMEGKRRGMARSTRTNKGAKKKNLELIGEPVVGIESSLLSSFPFLGCKQVISGGLLLVSTCGLQILAVALKLFLQSSLKITTTINESTTQ
jgi:hypothetical protein